MAKVVHRIQRVGHVIWPGAYVLAQLRRVQTVYQFQVKPVRGKCTASFVELIMHCARTTQSVLSWQASRALPQLGETWDANNDRPFWSYYYTLQLVQVA